LFCDAEVTVDALLASACLPQLFPAVEIDGEAYWDGGYSSNLPLRPLIEAGAPADVIFVRTAPVEQTDIPRSPGDIQARTAELGFRVALRPISISFSGSQQTHRWREMDSNPRSPV
jgi:NTE family protein